MIFNRLYTLNNMVINQCCLTAEPASETLTPKRYNVGLYSVKKAAICQTQTDIERMQTKYANNIIRHDCLGLGFIITRPRHCSNT